MYNNDFSSIDLYIFDILLLLKNIKINTAETYYTPEYISRIIIFFMIEVFSLEVFND